MRIARPGLVLVFALALVGCSRTVPAQDVETQVRGAAADAGFEVDAVRCPDALPAKVDARVVCTFTETNGTQHPVDVTAVSVADGSVRFNVVEQTTAPIGPGTQ